MKQLFRMMLLSAVSVTMPLSIVARDHSDDPDHFFMTIEEVPNSVAIIPAPPTPESARFAYDREQWDWGKTLRDTERGKQAISDANLDDTWVDRAFSEAVGVPLTRENYPVLCGLLYKMREDAGDLACRSAKEKYQRTRPFVYWNEPTSTPWDEEFLRTNGSYPSGHTSIGWATALVLAEVFPDRATEILDRGFQFGQSRVIVGAHYQSDVDQGRVCGSGLVARMHAKKEFVDELNKAKAEVAAKAAANTNVAMNE